MKKAVFIDWDDTLGDWSTAARLAQEDVYQQFGIASWGVRFEDWFEAYHTHNAELWHLYGHGQIDRPYLMMDRFLHPICAVKGIAKEDGEAYKPLAMEMSSLFLAQTNAHFRLLPDAREVVEYLAGKYALTVVSNGFAEVQHYKLEKSGLLPYFKHVVLSEEVGALKPGARIFEVAMEMNRKELPYLEKEDVVMVGDSWGSDIEGAMNAGIDAVWVTFEQSEQALPEGVQAVRRLREVMEAL
ncbi:MAG: YjjG family noncanonical pyrimidine nucleotidase [Paludibacteraceae bacterium]